MFVSSDHDHAVYNEVFRKVVVIVRYLNKSHWQIVIEIRVRTWLGIYFGIVELVL